MEVYFIRHGETDGNRARRHQHTETPLNERGIAQAEAVAKSIATIAPTHILTSPFVRTMQTTRIISTSYQEVIPSVSNLFAELLRPDDLTGGRFFALETVGYLWGWLWGNEQVTGESYTALRARVKKARDLLATFPADARVVVISHSVFINFFLAHMCDERPLSIWRATRLLAKIFTMKNTSITAVEYVGKEGKEGAGTCAWRHIPNPTSVSS